MAGGNPVQTLRIQQIRVDREFRESVKPGKAKQKKLFRENKSKSPLKVRKSRKVRSVEPKPPLQKTFLFAKEEGKKRTIKQLVAAIRKCNKSTKKAKLRPFTKVTSVFSLLKGNAYFKRSQTNRKTKLFEQHRQWGQRNPRTTSLLKKSNLHRKPLTFSRQYIQLFKNTNKDWSALWAHPDPNATFFSSKKRPIQFLESKICFHQPY